MSNEATALVSAACGMLFLFGPSILRVLLRPAPESMTDLRLAVWESWVVDLEKFAVVRRKLADKAKEKLVAADKAEEKAAEALDARAEEAASNASPEKRDPS